MSARSLGLLMAVALAGHSAVATEPLSEVDAGHAGPWHIHAVYDGGDLLFCAADRGTGAGMLRIGTDGWWWDIRYPFAGEGEFATEIRADGRVLTLKALAIGQGWAVIDVTPDLHEVMASATTMTITMDATTRKFAIDGIDAAFAEAAACAGERGTGSR